MELGRDDVEAQLVEIRESDMEATSNLCLEDLPEGVVRESMRNLAGQCLASAVRLGTVSKLFFCYYFGEIVSNEELSDSLIKRQQCHKLEEQNSKARRNQCWRSVLEGGVWNVLAAALELVGCFVLATVTVIYLTKAVRGAEPCWLLVALVIVLLHCFCLVIVSVIISLGRPCQIPEAKILCRVAWVLLIPFVLTICLFIVAAFVNEKIIGEKQFESGGADGGAYLIAFAAPQSLVSGAMLSEFFAFLAWVRDSPSLPMSSRAASLHVCHIVCEAMLIAYMVQYFRLALE